MRRFTICAVLLLFAGAFAQAQDEDLILYFDYEEFDGANAIDKSGKGHNGVVNGDIRVNANGRHGAAAEFSSGSFIDMDGPNWPEEDIPTDGMSVVAWVNVENISDQAIFNARAADETWLVHPEVRGDGNFRWLLRSDGGATIFDIRAGVAKAGDWAHYAGTYDGNTGELYIDGVKVGDAAGGGRVAGDWGLGARVGFNIDNARPFTGLMDDLNLWKRGLTEDEILTIMEFGPLPQAVSAKGKTATLWASLKRR